MFARSVSLRLKPNTLTEFTRIIETEVLPVLRKQPGFQNEITFNTPGSPDVIAMSLWESNEQMEAYNSGAYSDVLKSLEKVLDGAPRVKARTVISSTLGTTAAIAA